MQNHNLSNFELPAKIKKSGRRDFSPFNKKVKSPITQDYQRLQAASTYDKVNQNTFSYLFKIYQREENKENSLGTRNNKLEMKAIIKKKGVIKNLFALNISPKINPKSKLQRI